MKIFTLEISFPYSEDDESWSKVVEVREDFTFRQLHKYIQKLVEFDDDHLSLVSQRLIEQNQLVR